MVSLFRAEWQKLSGNRIVTAVFVWIYPISALMLLIFAAIAVLASETFRQQVLNAPPEWTSQLVFPWLLINSVLGRMFLALFAADAFGGEYQRMMWKNLIPRRRRVTLILNKFFTIGVFALFAFLLMCLIVGVGIGVVAGLAGAPYGPALADLTPEAWQDFLTRFWMQAGVAFAATLIAASYAALGGIYTRSILGAVAVSALLTIAEEGVGLVVLILSQLSENPGLLQVYKLTPGYNLANVSSWARFGEAYTPPYMLPYSFSEFSAGLSAVITVVWLVGLIGLTTYLFRRQDVMN